MEYILKTENKDAIEWMQYLLQNTIESKGHNAALVAYPHLKEWLDMFERAEVRRGNSSETTEINLLDDSEPAKPKVKAAAKKGPASKKPAAKKKAAPKKRRAKKKAIDKSGLTCNTHKTYQAKRVPRTDCKECWEVYKKFHPLEYDQKRSKFLRDQRSKK